MSESPEQPESPSRPAALRVRYRIRFAKTGLLRWISHRDLAHLWERLVRRAALPLSMTEGFHPKPRIAFPSALALGAESLDEVVELELSENLSPHRLLKILQNDRQPGLTIRSVKQLPEGFGKAQLQHSDYVITPPDSADLEATQTAIDRLTATETVCVERKKKTFTAHVASQILSLEIRKGQLHLSLAACDTASLRPGDVLKLLAAGDWTDHGATIVRTGVVLQREFHPKDPDQYAQASPWELSGPASGISGPVASENPFGADPPSGRQELPS